MMSLNDDTPLSYIEKAHCLKVSTTYFLEDLYLQLWLLARVMIREDYDCLLLGRRIFTYWTSYPFS